MGNRVSCHTVKGRDLNWEQIDKWPAQIIQNRLIFFLLETDIISAFKFYSKILLFLQIFVKDGNNYDVYGLSFQEPFIFNWIKLLLHLPHTLCQSLFIFVYFGHTKYHFHSFRFFPLFFNISSQIRKSFPLRYLISILSCHLLFLAFQHFKLLIHLELILVWVDVWF